MLSVADIIKGAKICQYLASNDIAKGSLFGARQNPRLGIQLYIERKAVEFQYNIEGVVNGNTPSNNLIGAANYLYKLWASYLFDALYLLATGGIIPPVYPPTGGGGGIVSRLYSVSYTALVDGETQASFLSTKKGDVPAPIPSNAIIVAVTIGISETFSYTVGGGFITLTDGLSLFAGQQLFIKYQTPN